jgi:hypothetical protein
MINDASQLPAGIAIGKRVVVYPTTVGSDPFVQRIIYITKTKDQ